MNIRKIFDSVPQEDAFLNIWIADKEIERIFPEYIPHSEKCICIYGATEEELDKALIKIKSKGDYYTNKIKTMDLNGLAWDVECKHVFLFESRECAFLFEDFANILPVEEFFDFISELQLDYNIPWTHVQIINQTRLHEIIDNYEERLGYGFNSI